MMKRLISGLFLMSLVLMAACAPTVQVSTPTTTMQLAAPGANPMINQPDAQGRVARAGAGLWHGIISPATLIVSFFNSDVRMYEVHNAGSEYDFGFFIGLGLIISLLGLFIRLRR